MEKTKLITEIKILLDRLALLENEETAKPEKEKTNLPVLLTIAECTELVSGLTANTVRKLVLQNKVSAIRAGEGGRGKILVNKDSLLRYLAKVMG